MNGEKKAQPLPAGNEQAAIPEISANENAKTDLNLKDETNTTVIPDECGDSLWEDVLAQKNQ